MGCNYSSMREMPASDAKVLIYGSRFAEWPIAMELEGRFIIRPTLVLYSQSGKTSYRQISRSLEIATLYVIMLASFWNLTSISAVLLPMCLSNVRAIGKVQTRISGLRDFMRSCGKTSYRLVNRGPVDVSQIPPLVIGIEHRWYKMKTRRNHPQLKIKYTVWFHFRLKCPNTMWDP